MPIDGNDRVTPRLQCPYCSGALALSGDSYICRPCERDFPVIDNIPCFVGRSTQLQRGSQLPNVSGTAEGENQIPWQQALISIAARSQSALDFLEEAVSPCVASSWVLTRHSGQCDALVLRCGWGASAFALSRSFASVVGCDAHLEKLKLAQLRARQESTNNVSFALAQKTPLLPFAPGQFDLILLCIDGGADSNFQALLAQAVAQLKPGGQVVLFAPNPWSLWRQRITAPRPRAPLGTRTLSLSLRGYRSRFVEAGFRQTSCWLAFPNQHSLRALISPQIQRSALRYFEEQEPARSGSFRLRAKAFLSPALAPDFCWIAGREPQQKSFLERLGAHILDCLEPGAAPGIVCQNFRVTRREVATCELQLGPARANVIVKIPLSNGGQDRAGQEHTNLRLLEARLNGAELWAEIPRPLLDAKFEETPFFVQEAKQGYPGLGFMGRMKSAFKWRESALEFLLRVHEKTVTRLPLTEQAWAERVLPHLSPGLLATQEHTNICAEKIEDHLKTHLFGLDLPFIFRHGDYWPGNLLFDSRGTRITGVIDWDRARPDSLPLLDLLDALISGRAEEEASTTPRLFDRIAREGMSPDELRLIEKYQYKMDFSLSEKQLQMFLLMDWLMRVSVRASPQYSAWWGEYEWIRSNVPASAAWIKLVCGF